MALFHTTVLDNQIKALPTVDTASGSVATFDTDMTENLVSCVCEVASGASEIDIVACGINIWNEQWEVGTLNASGGEIPSTTQFRNIGYIPVRPAMTLYIKSPFTAGIQIVQYDITKTYLSRIFIKDSTITLRNDCAFIRFRTPDTNPVVYDNDISINYPSTDTDYHAFSGKYINVAFGETLSGDGSFDVLSGILTRSDDTTKQLDANYIQTLNGLNNIWCDTNGDTSVKYILSVGKAIS